MYHTYLSKSTEHTMQRVNTTGKYKIQLIAIYQYFLIDYKNCATLMQEINRENYKNGGEHENSVQLFHKLKTAQNIKYMNFLSAITFLTPDHCSFLA
jgi:hypothetical protein